MPTPTYQATTVRGAKDVLTAALRRIDAEVRGELPGDREAQRAADDAPLDLAIHVDFGELENLAASLSATD